MRNRLESVLEQFFLGGIAMEDGTNSDLDRARVLAKLKAQLEAQPHAYSAGESIQLEGESVTNGLRASLTGSCELVICIRNYNDPAKIGRVEVHRGFLFREFATKVNLGEVFPELSNWLEKYAPKKSILSAEGFFNGGMDFADALGVPVSFVLTRGQGCQEERQFSPRREH